MAQQEILRMFAMQPPREFELRGFKVSIKSVEVENGTLKVDLSATKDGKPAKADLPYYYKNPPTMVPDGTTSIIKDQKGNDIVIDNFKEDFGASLEEMITQTLESQN